jgi:hypothetical protein
MEAAIHIMIEDCYQETVLEALQSISSKLTAHKEGITAAAMLLAAMTGIEDEPARRQVVALGLRPAEGGDGGLA